MRFNARKTRNALYLRQLIVSSFLKYVKNPGTYYYKFSI